MKHDSDKRRENILNNIEKSKDFLIVVEGKKDKAAMQKLGFSKIFVINETGKSLYEKIEEIERLAEGNTKGNKRKNRVCILTDFDKKGKQLYLLIKRELGKKRVRLDNSLRVCFLKSNVSHIEGICSFLEIRDYRKINNL